MELSLILSNQPIFSLSCQISFIPILSLFISQNVSPLPFARPLRNVCPAVCHSTISILVNVEVSCLSFLWATIHSLALVNEKNSWHSVVFIVDVVVSVVVWISTTIPGMDTSKRAMPLHCIAITFHAILECNEIQYKNCTNNRGDNIKMMKWQ